MQTTQRGPRISLRGRFLAVIVAFSIAITLLLTLSHVGFQALSGARAYVHGESQWAKAQKQSVISLLEYALEGSEKSYQDHLDALAVIYGDRRARLTLDSMNPDFDIAREGFLDGRNHPDDIELMIRLFRYGRNLESFEQAVNAWAQADVLIDRLVLESEQLRDSMTGEEPDGAAVRQHVTRILEIDRQLTEQEDFFSGQIGQLSKQLERVFSFATALTALMLIATATLLSLRLLRRAERYERALRESEERYRALADQPEIGIWQTNAQGLIRYLNPAMRFMLGLTPDEPVEGTRIDQFIADSHLAQVRADRETRARGFPTTNELQIISVSGEHREVLTHGAPVIVDEGILRGHVGTCLDITERKKAEEQLRYQAFYDSLTGLPNRQLFLDRLAVSLKRARRDKTQIAVFFIDLDRFKIVNDSLGHASGDKLLRQAARRLKAAVRERDTLARFGGDEFGMLLEDVESAEEAQEPARRVIEALKADFSVRGVTARIGASIGIALSTEDDEPADLLRYADIAMYVAKRSGGGNWHVFDPDRDSQEVQRLHLEGELWMAVEQDELLLHYQPIVNLETGETIGLEALVRWQHPRKGLLSPIEFIPMAEETGAIKHIGQWVSHRACQDQKMLKHRLGKRAPLMISVNVSAAEFRFENPVSRLYRAVTSAGLSPSEFCLEVTESLLMEDPEALAELKAKGFQIAVDDFGTGYASLDRLRDASFNTVKIDQTFIRKLTTSKADQAIVAAIIHIAHKLGMNVIAEGIETADQVEALRNLGCTSGQGYLYSRPAPLEELIREPKSEPARAKRNN